MNDTPCGNRRRWRGRGLRRRYPRLAAVFDRIVPPPSVCAEVEGFRIFVDPKNEATSATAISSGDYEPHETRFIRSVLKPGQRFVDIGANVGYFSCLAAQLVGREGKVYAFEADRQNYRLLEKSIRANRFSQVAAECAAVSDHDGQLKIYRSLVNNTDHRTYDCAEGPDPNADLDREAWETKRPTAWIPCLRVDDRVPAPVDVIKIDIQGAEVAAFRGMPNLIDQSPNLTVLTEFFPAGLTAAGSSPEAFLAILRGHGLTLQTLEGRVVTDDEILASIPECGYTNLVASRR